MYSNEDLKNWVKDEGKIVLITEQHAEGRVEHAIKMYEYCKDIDFLKEDYPNGYNQFYESLRLSYHQKKRKRACTGFSDSNCRKIRTEGEVYLILGAVGKYKGISLPQTRTLAVFLRSQTKDNNELVEIWKRTLEICDNQAGTASEEDIRQAVAEMKQEGDEFDKEMDKEMGNVAEHNKKISELEANLAALQQKADEAADKLKEVEAEKKKLLEDKERIEDVLEGVEPGAVDLQKLLQERASYKDEVQVLKGALSNIHGVAIQELLPEKKFTAKAEKQYSKIGETQVKRDVVMYAAAIMDIAEDTKKYYTPEK